MDYSIVLCVILVTCYIDTQKENKVLREENDALKAEILALRAEKKLRQAEDSDFKKISDGKRCCMLCLADSLSTGYVELICMQVMMLLQGGVLPSKVTRHNIWNGSPMVLGCTFPSMCSLLMSPKAR